jgi:hypothetical protein
VTDDATESTRPAAFDVWQERRSSGHGRSRRRPSRSTWWVASAVAKRVPRAPGHQGCPLERRCVPAFVMIDEYARHNGHADFLREGIDGTVGV